MLALALLGAGVSAYRARFAVTAGPDVSQEPVSTGDITGRVKATGTLYALRTVDIGTQVSGIVEKMDADFNSIVRKGEVLAEIDPSTEQADLDSARAAATRAQIDLDQARQVRANDQRNLTRAEALFAEQVATQQERDDAEVQVRSDDAQVVQDEAALAVADANVKQADVNLTYCTITSPIDGVVIARNADEGQAVAARMSVPSLYTLGTDLTQLQLVADVDEADISQVAVNEPASFQVETYPGVAFASTVREVRLNATSSNDVVTYQVILDAPNADLRLKPGMTTNVSIEVSHARQAVTVPNAALQFHPTRETFTALGQTPPPTFKLAPPPATSDVTSAQPPQWAVVSGAAHRSARTIDELLTPYIPTALPGQVWVLQQRRLVPVPLQVGITDGTRTQVLSGDVHAGEPLVTRVTLPGAPAGPVRPTGGIFAPQRRAFGRGF